MNSKFAIAFVVIGMPFASLPADTGCGPRRVALSFDDAPTGDTVVMSGQERSQRILEALQEGGVAEAIFFAVSSRIDSATTGRMHAYAEAGHVIANHSHTHPNLHNVGSETFLVDVGKAHEVLSELPRFQPYFRFPYLNEGSTEEERDAVRAGLHKLGHRAGYVTIDNFDFYIDRLLRQAWEDGQTVDLEAAGELYVEMILGAAVHYDDAACTWLGRSPAHVLLLHENDAAAFFLPPLITGLKNAGWEIIAATEAYADPISEVSPDTLFLGQGQVAAMAVVAGAEETELRHEGESNEVLRARFELLTRSPAHKGE